MTNSTPRDPHTVPALITMLGTFHVAMEQIVAALGEAHGRAPGPWLDDLERQTIHAMKSMQAKGVSEADEMEGIAAALRHVTALFAALRDGSVYGEAD